jgi:ADP-ribose pyrophosphatase YjhB (NUDIX family)
MYKVFFNKKSVVLTTIKVDTPDTNPLLFLKYTNQEFIITALKSKKVKGLYLYHPKEKKLWKHFKKLFPQIDAAGGLVEHLNGKILFIFRNDQWDLPKGKIEKNELIIDGAVREVIEETGVKDLIVKKPLPTTFHLFKRNGSYKLKKTYWYLMTTSFEGNLIPQIEEGINQAMWKSKEDISDLMVNAYENIKVLVKEVL